MKKLHKIALFSIFTMILHFAAAEEALNSAAASHSQKSYSRPVVTNISASPYSSNKIIVSWSVPTTITGDAASYKITELLVYRSTRAITSYSDVDDLKPLAKLPASAQSYRDTLSDYKNYFYAVVSIIQEKKHKEAPHSKSGKPFSGTPYYDEDLDGDLEEAGAKIYPLILPGVNASVTGVKVMGNKYAPEAELPIPKEKKQYKDGQMREQPLPYMDLLSEDGKSRVKTSRISPSAKEKASELIEEGNSTPQKPKPLEQYVFSEDVISPPGGDEYLLFDVLKGAFINRRWQEAAADLEKFLLQHRTKAVTDRANFYLGECYYFMGEYPKALNQFLLLHETYPVLTRKWSKSALDLYTLPKE